MKDVRLAGSKADGSRAVFRLGDLRFGEDFVVIAGPCSIESERQMTLAAIEVKKAGANMLRGGAFKPRTSPYAFQGLGIEGLRILAKVREETGLPVVTEVLDPRDVREVSDYADMLQVGSRNMQNHALLREVGRAGRPVLLKRGMHSTLEEWLNSAEYVMSEGNERVVLCERGIRTFETYTRNTLDLGIACAARKECRLPILVDPSHGTGIPALVGPMSLAAVAAGVDGLLVEVHPDPERALSDAGQQIDPATFEGIVRRARKLRAFLLSMEGGPGWHP